MPRSPFAAAPSYAIANRASAARGWTPGARTVAREAAVQTRKKAAEMQQREPVVPLSVRLVNAACKGIGRAAFWTRTKYPLLRSFVLAHAAGMVNKATIDSREADCRQCSFRYDRGGVKYCRGANNGKGCGCGHWPASRLGYKLTLAAFRCPQRRFDYGGLAAWLFRK
jgi:hypothetical protein